MNLDNIKQYWLPALIAFLIIAFASFVGYASGSSMGESRGYDLGYLRAWSYYPQLEVDEITWETSQGTIVLRGLTFIGEQHLIDLLESQDLSNIVSFSDNTTSEWKYEGQ